MQLTEAADPIAVGREANYAITIRNDQNQDDKDLVLAIDVPMVFKFCRYRRSGRIIQLNS